MKNSKSRSLLVLALLLTCGSLTTAYGQITPTGDAYTNSVDPTTNYGAKTLLDVDGASQITYIQFNLASIPSGASVSKATLKLYVNGVTTAGSLNVDYVNGAWSEGTITYNNAPALGSTIVASVSVPAADKNQYILIDITPAVVAWLNGSQANDGIALVANGSFNATFDSKENTTTSHSAELDIVFSGGGTITGVLTGAGSGLTGGGSNGTLNLSLTNACAANQVLQWNGTAWACANLKGGGTVTSVGLSAPSSDFTVTGSPVNSSGTLGLNWNVAPTNLNAPNAIVKRDSSGSFNADNLVLSGNLGLSGNLSVSGNSNLANSYLTGTLGIGTTSPRQALDVWGGAIEVTGTDHNGTAYISSSGGTAFFSTDTMANGIAVSHYGTVGIGTATPQAELNLNFGGQANSDTLLIGNNSSKGLQLRDTGSGVDLESIGVPLYVNYVTQQPLYLNPNGGATYIGPGAVPIASPGALNVGAIVDAGSYQSAVFSNDVLVLGNFLVQGTKNFRIDHPLDPKNKYLQHAAIESSEVLNQYSGNVILDDKGEARVQFPAWFAAINEDFRYQLTAVGAPGPNLYIAKKIKDSSFRIAGGTPGAEVSWQVTARRNDAYMKAHPFIVEKDKPEGARGHYTLPELYGEPREQGILTRGQIAAKRQ